MRNQIIGKTKILCSISLIRAFKKIFPNPHQIFCNIKFFINSRKPYSDYAPVENPGLHLVDRCNEKRSLTLSQCNHKICVSCFANYFYNKTDLRILNDNFDFNEPRSKYLLLIFR